MNKQQIEMLNKLIQNKINEKISDIPFSRGFSKEEKENLLKNNKYKILYVKKVHMDQIKSYGMVKKNVPKSMHP